MRRCHTAHKMLAKWENNILYYVCSICGHKHKFAGIYNYDHDKKIISKDFEVVE